jgi:hypothetical protein
MKHSIIEILHNALVSTMESGDHYKNGVNLQNLSSRQGNKL